jgi:sulfatase maturation enzyme AslB (radical SAM superfamily)
MVKYLNENNIASVISSNFNYLTPELAETLVKNKLTHLIVCLDGFDQESYQKFRNGGDFDKVINNINLIQAEKARQKSKWPFLEIQTIRLKYFSISDLNKIKVIAESLGADNFLIKDDLSDFYNHPQPVEKSCFWLYGSPQIKWNGLVQPCCYYYEDKNNDWGDLSKDNFKNIWNNEKYQAARKYFKTGIKNNHNLKCYDCSFFKKNYVK